MKYILVILFFTLASSQVFSQGDSGIYLSIKCGKGSLKHTTMMTNKQICLAPSPMILPAEFNAITDVMTRGNHVWFDMTISLKAVQVLSQISSNLPSSTFALVVEKQVFYTFPANDLRPGRIFRFQGEIKDQGTFHTMQKRLKTLIESNVPQ